MTGEVRPTDEGEESGVSPLRIAMSVGIAMVLIFAVAFFGWYQFAHRAGPPMDLVREHRIPGTGETIEEGIEAYLEDRGVEIARGGFKPTWGAEETEDDVWVVSFVFEVGREAQWVSWRVHEDSGKVQPVDEVARELWEGG